jgi:hypothetical protein
MTTRNYKIKRQYDLYINNYQDYGIWGYPKKVLDSTIASKKNAELYFREKYPEMGDLHYSKLFDAFLINHGFEELVKMGEITF